MSRRFLIALGVVLLPLVFVACGGDNEPPSVLEMNEPVEQTEPPIDENPSEMTEVNAQTDYPSFSGDGTFIIGEDVEPGTYRGSGGADCNFTQSTTLPEGGIRDSFSRYGLGGFPDGPVVVTLAPYPTGTIFETSGCGTWTQDLSQVTASQTSFGDGTFIVGTDVRPGTYRSSVAEGTHCEWRRLNGFSAEYNRDTIVRVLGFPLEPLVMTIEAVDTGFESFGCGTWMPVTDHPTDTQTSFGNGTFIVGTDIMPGVYRNDRTNLEPHEMRTACSWRKRIGFNGNSVENIVSARVPSSEVAIVTIADSDVGFSSRNCGIWTLDSELVDTFPTSFGDGIFEVRTDILEGVYRNSGGANCSFTQHISSNPFLRGPTITMQLEGRTAIRLGPFDNMFESSGCGTWTLGLSQITDSQTSFEDGFFVVGVDIMPGTYRSNSNLETTCSWSRLDNLGIAGLTTLGNRGVQVEVDGPAVVTIAPNDAGFTSQNCGTWTRDLSQITASQTSFGSGTFIVGTDILPGTYRASNDEESSEVCSFQRLRSFGGTPRDLNGASRHLIAQIAETIGRFAVVTILETDAGFTSRNCGTWTQELSQITDSQTSFGDGVFIVGTDIVPGVYHSSGDDTAEESTCVYVHLNSLEWDGFGFGDNDIKESEPTTVTIDAASTGFLSFGCGTWIRES